MPSSFIDAVSEQRINDYITNRDQQHALYRTNATPQMAQAAAKIYRNSPWLTPGQVLALAKGNASPQATALASQAQSNLVPQMMDPQKPKKQSWFERNVYGKVKETARWGFASLQLAPELAQNVASQIFSENDPAGWDGWFKSTNLGTMVADSEDAGTGWFVGGTAEEKQAERARQFRGTINGSAWTIGRGAAAGVFKPGSVQYNVLSGFLDAAVAIVADPTVIGGKVTAPLRGSRATIKGLQSVEEIAAATKIANAGTRALAGLSAAEEIAFDSSKFMKFFQTDRRAVRLVETLADPANDNPYKIMRDVFDFKIDMDTAKALANAGSKDQIYALLGEQSAILDNVSKGIMPTDIRDIRGAKWGNVVRERIPMYNNFRRTIEQSRLLTEVPDSLVIHGSSADRVKAVKDYGNYLNTIKGGFTDTPEGEKLMRQIFDAYSDTSKSGVDAARDAFDTTVKTLMEAEGADPLLIKTVFDKVLQNIDETKAYFVNESGDATDAGFVQQLITSGVIDRTQFGKLTPQQIEQFRLVGPGSIVELLNSAHVLPDIRAVRRMTANPVVKRAVMKAKDGDQRAAIEIADYLQNKIWKPITLATGGYIMRNMFDAQVRMAVIGKEGFFNHPLRYIQWAMNEKGAERIIGRDFDEFIKSTVSGFDDATDYYAEAMKISLGKSLDDVVPSQVRLVKNGSYKIVSQMTEPEMWVNGLRDEIIQISKDTLENAVAKGISTDDLITYLRNDPKGREALKQIEDYLRGGINLAKESGYSQKVKITNVTDDVLKEWIDKLARGRVLVKTGGDEELMMAIAYKRVPLADTFDNGFKILTPKTVELDGVVRNVLDGPLGKPGRGSLIDMGVDPKTKEQIYAVVVNESGGRWQLQRVSTNQFTGVGVEADELARGRTELTKMIQDKKKVPNNLPAKVKFAERNVVDEAKNPLDKMLRRGTDWFFHQIYESKVVNKLERSPVYRQFYYEQVAKNVDSLTPAEATKLVSDIKAQALGLEMKPWDYVGSKANWKQIQDLATKARGTGTIRDLDDYAGLSALNSTKEALFNATERNNLEDIMRIVIPFGAAWREVVGTYAKFLVEDPTRIRRAQLLFKGATDFDPDGNGRGFFYKDPTTNQYSFNFPLSGELAKLVTGVNAPLQGTVKRVSVGLDWHPALGPVGQIAADQIIPDTPKYDGIASILMPYGRGTSASFVPSWARKLKSAIEADPSKLDGIYGNTYVDVMRALSASGDYDLNTSEGEAKLFADAKGKARILTAMRAIGQFLGPTAPGTEFEIPTKDGDIMASQLIQEFYKLQADNYDTAVGEFLRIYGEDALLYLSSKSKATVEGLEATKEFGDWERTNGDVIKAYPDVASFFAPGGSDFDFQVWQRQIKGGKRVRLTDKQVIEQAQYRLASSQYKAYRSQVGAYPNEEQRAWLKGIRIELNKKYPGFPVVPVFTVGEFEKKLGQMRDAVSDPRLRDNDVAKAVNTYLGYRDQVLSQWVAGGGSAQGLATAKSAEPLRGYLTSIGDALALQVPDFGRVWERELLSEVDQ
jgi:hypothetical protein